jgi:hypothetical protein
MVTPWTGYGDSFVGQGYGYIWLMSEKEIVNFNLSQHHPNWFGPYVTRRATASMCYLFIRL